MTELSTGLSRQIIVNVCVANVRVRHCVYPGEFLCEHVYLRDLWMHVCVSPCVRWCAHSNSTGDTFRQLPTLSLFCFLLEMQQKTFRLHLTFFFHDLFHILDMIMS